MGGQSLNKKETRLASVDVGDELRLPLAAVCALTKEDNPGLVHVRHGEILLVKIILHQNRRCLFRFLIWKRRTPVQTL